MAAGRLYKVAQVLGIEVGYFFEGLQGGGTLKVTPQQGLTLELANNFLTSCPEHQQAISSLGASSIRSPVGKAAGIH